MKNAFSFFAIKIFPRFFFIHNPHFLHRARSFSSPITRSSRRILYLLLPSTSNKGHLYSVKLKRVGIVYPATMSMHPNEPLNFVGEDASYGSGEDNKHHHNQTAMPSSSGRQKRGRKTTGDAIVDAMLEIAAASKTRASILARNEDDFSISKCIQVLDDMQGVDQNVYFCALDLFEVPSARETFISLKRERRLIWLQRKCGASSNLVL